MYSSGMRIARLLTISQHALGRGLYLSMHCAEGRVCPGGCLPGVSVCGRPPPNKITDRCKKNTSDILALNSERTSADFCITFSYIHLRRQAQVSSLKINCKERYWCQIILAPYALFPLGERLKFYIFVISTSGISSQASSSSLIISR